MKKKTAYHNFPNKVQSLEIWWNYYNQLHKSLVYTSSKTKVEDALMMLAINVCHSTEAQKTKANSLLGFSHHLGNDAQIK